MLWFLLRLKRPQPRPPAQLSFFALFSLQGGKMEQLDNEGDPLIFHDISAFVQLGTVVASVTASVTSREAEGLM